MPRPRLARCGTAAALVASRLWRRDRGPAVADVDAAIATLPPGLARIARVVTLRPGADWLDTGVELAAGDTVTLLGSGRLWMSRALGVGCDARVALWHRIGAHGPIAKSLADTSTFVAGAAGPLHLVTKPPGEWLDDRGRFDPNESRRGMSGQLAVAIVVWHDPSSLEAAAAAAPGGLFARERDRRADPAVLPAEWTPLWRLGSTRIYRSAVIDGRAAMTCHTHGDVGIVRRPVDLPLAADTRLAWSWRIHELPSAWPEDLTPTHDYLSIAVEFDNGRDLTYLWSVGLPVGTVFQCPLPWWCGRETHLVVRRGRADLGAWCDEHRALLDDYRDAVGGPAPTRVVGVWLIAVSVFQRRPGRCDYAGIRLTGSGTRLDVL